MSENSIQTEAKMIQYLVKLGFKDSQAIRSIADAILMSVLDTQMTDSAYTVSQMSDQEIKNAVQQIIGGR